MEDATVSDQVVIPKSSSSSVTAVAERPSPAILSPRTSAQSSESAGAGARVSGDRARHESADANSPAFASALAEYMRFNPSGFGEQHLLSSPGASSSSAVSTSASAAEAASVSSASLSSAQAGESLKQESSSCAEQRERAPNRKDKQHAGVESADPSCVEEFKPAFWYLCTSPTSNRTDTTVSLDSLAIGAPTIVFFVCFWSLTSICTRTVITIRVQQ